MSNFPRWKKVDWTEVRVGDSVSCSSRTADIHGIVTKAGLNSFAIDNINVLSSFDGTIQVDENYRKGDASLPTLPGSVIVAYSVEGNEGCWNMLLDYFGNWCSPQPIGEYGLFEFPPSSIHNFDTVELVITDGK